MKKQWIILATSVVLSFPALTQAHHHKLSSQRLWRGVAVYAVAKATFPEVVPPFFRQGSNVEPAVPEMKVQEISVARSGEVYQGAFSQSAVDYFVKQRKVNGKSEE